MKYKLNFKNIYDKAHQLPIADFHLNNLLFKQLNLFIKFFTFYHLQYSLKYNQGQIKHFLTHNLMKILILDLNEIC